jgi:hypothetical protein
MNYAIEILEKEKQILKNCLSEWQSKNYPEAKAERENRLKNLEKAILIIKNN